LKLGKAFSRKLLKKQSANGYVRTARVSRVSSNAEDRHPLSKHMPVLPWNRSPRPFVKWAGGKGQLLAKLEKHFPNRFNTYYEPFLGGGAVFFHLVERRPHFSAVLSDVNEELINTYRVVKDQLQKLIRLLRIHKIEYRKAPKEYYYRIRTQEPADEAERAARLIFLNKTCYNGLYRVNRQGKFNVPFGKYKNPKICDKENLQTISQVLRWTNARLLSIDYQKATSEAGEGDFVYFDPPYQPVSSTASFTGYTDSGFSYAEQERLGKWFRQLDSQGCYVLLSNSDTREVLDIYDGYSIERVPALRAISCRGSGRKGHTELVISNQ